MDGLSDRTHVVEDNRCVQVVVCCAVCAKCCKCVVLRVFWGGGCECCGVVSRGGDYGEVFNYSRNEMCGECNRWDGVEWSGWERLDWEDRLNVLHGRCCVVVGYGFFSKLWNMWVLIGYVVRVICSGVGW